MSFKTYITETALTHEKLVHLQHAEDLPLVAGTKGFHHAFGALKAVGEQLDGKFNPTKTTIKYDGSPAVVFGHDPRTKKFFVASKSAFNKDPKINFTEADIRKNHMQAPGLQEKLIAALEHLKKVAPPHGVFQGDLMYTDQDKHESKEHINFTPNTIMYSLPKKSEQGKKAAKAKLGIAVHTQYAGPTLEKMKALPLEHPRFKEHPDVHILPHEVNLGDALTTGKDKTKFDFNMKMAEKMYNHLDRGSLDRVISPEHEHLAHYINSAVKEGKKPSVVGYMHHVLARGTKAAETVKTPVAKQKHMNAAIEHAEHIKNHAKHFEDFFKLHHHLQAAKDAIVNQLNSTTHGIEHSIGGKETQPEGFVVHHEGYPVKFVNRAEFSRANFEQSKNRK
jgi:hypothetical protein